MAKTTLTSETTCEFGGPQDNPQVSRFVEELTELSTSILLMLWFKIAKGLKSAREVMCRAGLRRVPSTELAMVLSQGSCMDRISFS